VGLGGRWARGVLRGRGCRYRSLLWWVRGVHVVMGVRGCHSRLGCRVLVGVGVGVGRARDREAEGAIV